MQLFLDTVFGFLPHRAVLLTGIGTSFLILIIHFGVNKIKVWFELPYMKKENQKARAKMVQQLRKEKQTES